MTDTVRVRLELDTSGAARSAKEIAADLRRALGGLKIGSNFIDLGSSRKQVQDLTADILKVKAALASGNQAQGLQKELAIYKEQIRFKQQLAKIEASAVTPEGAANARALAVELNKLNLQKIEQDFSQLSGTAKAGLQQITVAAGAVATAVGGLFVSGLQEFANFDRAIRQAGAVAGASESELKALSDEVERLGIVTTKTPTEVAQMSIELARAGFTADETTVALEGIVQASEATGESLSTVGDIIAKTLRVFNLSASESGKVADLLVQTANSTNTSVGGLGDSLRYVGQQAASSNQSLESTLIALGLLGDAGIQGTQAGTNLAEALNRLKIASAGSVTQFQGLVRGQKGATAAFEAIGAQVRNADGSLKQITDILPIVRSQLKGLAQEDQDVLLRALFGTQGGRAFGTLLNSSPDRIRTVTAAIQEAQGAAGETSEELRKGLSGALSLFQGSAGAFLQTFGEISAIPVEPVVRGATELLNAFNRLPAPIQATLVATTGLAGVLAAATATIAAYNLANGKLVVEQIRAAAGVVRTTVATTAQTTATAIATAGQLAWARATGTATAAQRAQLAAIGENVAKAGLLAAAVGAVTLAVREYQTSTQALEGSQEAIDNLAESTRKLKEAFAEAAEGTPEAAKAQADAIEANIQSVRDGFGTLDQVLESIREKIALIPEPIRQIATVLNPVLGAIGTGTTKLESQLNNQSIKFEEFRQNIENDVLKPYEQLANAPGGLENADASQLDAVRESIDTAIAELDQWKATTPEAAAAIDIYRQTLSNAALAIEQQRDAQSDLNDTTEEGTDKIGEQVKALEEQQRAAKEAADDARADSERALNRQLDDERRERQESNAEELGAIQKQNAEELAAIEKVNAAEVAELEKANALQLQETERAFNQEIAAFEEQEQSKLQAKEQAFQERQQQQEAAFNDAQRQREEEFQARLNERTAAQDQSFTEAQRLLDIRNATTQEERATAIEQRRIAQEIADLDLANQILPPERLAQLAQSIAGVGTVTNEDEARRVQDVLGQIQQQQQQQQQEADRLAEIALQQQLQAEETKFNETQEQRRAAFEQTIAQQRDQLEQAIEARKLAFESDVLTPLREEQEARLTALREQQELQLQDLREQQEAELEDRRRAFEASERDLDRQAEEDRIARDRAYRDEQRRLDRENEQALAAIRAQNRSTPAGATRDNQGNDISFTPRGLRKGGTFEGGEWLQLHKDELVVFPQGGAVISQRESRAIAREQIAPQLRQSIPTSQIAANLRRHAAKVSGPSFPSIDRPGVGEQKILKELQKLNSQISKMGRPNETTNVNMGDGSSAMAHLKAEARRLSSILGRG